MSMGARTIPIIQIVGYKNAGKTTVVKLLIESLKEAGYKVGAMKHHGHGGKPNRIEGTDSNSYLEAGAAVSAVQGDGEWQFTLTDKIPFDLDTMIQMQLSLGIDIIVIEGFKHLNYPKIVLLRDERDEELLELSNIHAVGGWRIPHDSEALFTFSIVDFARYKKELLELLIKAGEQYGENVLGNKRAD